MARIFALFLLGVAFPLSLFAQNPAADEDARDERMKILKAADQIEMIQSNSESLRSDVDNLKTQLATMQEDNASLKQQVADLKSSLEKMDAARAKEREVLLDEVSKLIASAPKPAPVESKKSEKINEDHSADTTPAKPQHGFNHVVEKGETLSMIAAAYRDKGVKVTVDDIRQANSLGANDVIKVGQKLFIPKE